MEAISHLQVVVLTRKIFTMGLESEKFLIFEINLLVMDQANNALKASHHFSKIVSDFVNQTSLSNRPRILGIGSVALPTKKNVKACLDSLEINLNSKVCPVEHNVNKALWKIADVAADTSQRKQAVDLLKTGLDNARDALTTWSKVEGECFSHVLSSVKDSCFVADEVALSAAGTFAQHCAQELEKFLKETNNISQDGKVVLSAACSALFQFGENCQQLAKTQSHLDPSSKLLTLMGVLVESECPRKERVLVLSQKRCVATELSRHLNNVFAQNGLVTSQPFVGQKNNKLTNAIQDNSTTLAHFESGKVNVVVATDAMTHGVSMPRCDTVVRFDSSTNSLQCFVSAMAKLKANGRLLFLESFDKTVKLRCDLESLEERLRQTLQTMDELNCEGDNPVVDASLDSQFSFVPNENGIVATASNSLSLLTNCCRMFPRRTNCNILFQSKMKTVFGPNGESKVLFGCSAILPMSSPVREVSCPTEFETKTQAKQMVCLLALKQLFEVGAVNEMFCVTREPALVFPGSQHVRRMVSEGPREMTHTKISAQCLEGNRPCGSSCFLYVFILTNVGEQRGFRPTATNGVKSTFGLLSAKRIPLQTMRNIQVSAEGEDLSVKIREFNVDFSDEQREKLFEFHFSLFQTLLATPLTSSLVPDDGDSPVLRQHTVVPLLYSEEPLLLDFDWEMVQKVSDWHRFGHRVPLSECSPDTLEGSVVFEIDPATQTTKTDWMNQPFLHCVKSLSAGTLFCHALSLCEPSASVLGMFSEECRELCARDCFLFPLNTSQVLMLKKVPAVVDAVESICIAKETFARLESDAVCQGEEAYSELHAGLVLSALTHPKTGRKTKMETLQLVGDSVLSLIVSTDACRATSATIDEMCAFHRDFTSSPALSSAALAKGFHMGMVPAPFLPVVSWIPPMFRVSDQEVAKEVSTRRTDDREIADVMVSVVGTLALCRGLDCARAFLVSLGLPLSQCPLGDVKLLGFSDATESEVVGFLPRSFQTLCNAIDWQFTDKRFLLNALTDESFVFNTITGSMDRLALVGQKVSDVALTLGLAENRPDADFEFLRQMRNAVMQDSIVNHVAIHLLMLHKNILHRSETLFDCFSKCARWNSRMVCDQNTEVVFCLSITPSEFRVSWRKSKILHVFQTLSFHRNSPRSTESRNSLLVKMTRT